MGRGIVDHRVKITLNNLDSVMRGEGLPELSQALQQYDNMDKLAAVLAEQTQS